MSGVWTSPTFVAFMKELKVFLIAVLLNDDDDDGGGNVVVV